MIFLVIRRSFSGVKCKVLQWNALPTFFLLIHVRVKYFRRYGIATTVNIKCARPVVFSRRREGVEGGGGRTGGWNTRVAAGVAKAGG